MATEEHKYLANIIKNTHATLRQEAQNYGPEIAWKRHICRKDILQEYASCMQELATTHWMQNNLNAKSSTCSRIEWIKFQCEEYFLNEEKQKYDLKEENIRLKLDTNFADTEVATNNCNVNVKHKKPIQKISLLDVGSCYNPFSAFDIFEVTAIDLNDIPGKVFYCDFLNVQIGQELCVSNKQEILQFPENHFQVVVFSLFLEYLPCPKQRYLCCKKAYDLLQFGGIFFIISPDSKHANANAKFMKSWRYVLSKLGFMRIKYEKLHHIHCIMFRKCVFKQVATRWANLQISPQDDPLFLDHTSIYIPQDFRKVTNEIKKREKQEYDTNEVMTMFNELPFEQSYEQN